MGEKYKQGRRSVLKSLGAGSLAGLAGCIGGGDGEGSSPATDTGTPTPVPESDFSLMHVPFGSVASHYVPLKNGWVDPVGRVGDIEWSAAFPSQMTNTVRGRSVDVADLSLGAHVIDHDRGEPYTGLVTENHVFQANAMFAHTDSGIEEVQDLEGKTIGIHSQSSASVIYSLGIAENLYDVDLSTVNWVNKAIPELWGLIQDGQIDATVLFADFWYLGQQHEDIVEIFNTNSEWKDWVGGTTIFQLLVARPKLIEDNPGLDVDLVNSLRESRAYRNENIDETLEQWIESNDADVSLDFLKQQAINLDCTFDLTDGDRATMEKFVELANEQGVIDSTPSVDEMFTDTVDEVGHVDCYRALDTTLDC